MSTASFDAPGTVRDLGSAVYRDEDFPGCESFHLPASEIDHYEGRLEFWDGATETAWKVPETPIQHEGPSRQLTQMAARLAMVRGSRISSLGSSDLVHLDAAGRKRWLMQADELLYLHRDLWSRLQGPAIDVDADPLPDVVLEVDHTTDVRRRKLGIYKESGFPEIWVLVPWESSVRAPGLAIHVRHGEEYREEAASRAFPGWRAEEIHLALTEAPMSEAPMSETAWRALERTALAMGAREGTTPEDDPLMRSVLLKVYGEGYATSYAEAYRKAFEEARRQAIAECALAMLDVRGIEVSSQILEDWKLLAELPSDLLMAAAVHCRGGRLPAANPRAPRSAHGDSALTRSGVDARRAPGVSEGVGGRLSCVAGVGGLRSGIGGPWRNRELMEPANDLCPSGTRKMHGTGEFVDREPFLGKEQRELGGKDGGEQLVEHEGVGVVELRSAKHAGEGRRRGPLGDAGEVGRGDYREQGMVVALGVREGGVVDGRRGFGIGKPGERHGFDGHGVFRFCGEDPKRLVRPTNE